MTKDMQDRLLTWITKQERSLRADFERTEFAEFERGRYSALMDVKVFLMTDGRLQEPSLPSNLVGNRTSGPGKD